ncbi:MAG: hypothetical protein ACP5IC_02735 [Minisyncoccia bacterium]
MNKNYKFILFFVIVLFLVALILLNVFKNNTNNNVLNLDSFAKCLTDKGFVLYGLYSCPHCQAQKNLFGNSLQYIKYVECSQNTQLCIDKHIDAVPTWIGPDGKQIVGEQSLERLSQLSGCLLNK